jgi:hypothetical protein
MFPFFKPDDGQSKEIYFLYFFFVYLFDHLYALVVRVPGYRSRGPEFDSRRYQIFREMVGLGLGPLSLVSTTEELLGRKISDFGL